MMTDEVRCARHPNEETSLRCGRCGKPICVRCMRYTSVGIRCDDCARPARSGINAPTAGHILRAAAVAAGAALVAGVLWGLFPTYAFWLALLLGFGGGDLISTAARRRKGPEIQAVAAGMVLGAFVLAYVLRAGFGGQLIAQTLFAALALGLAVVRQR